MSQVGVVTITVSSHHWGHFTIIYSGMYFYDYEVGVGIF